jgi:hypothetical protein
MLDRLLFSCWSVTTCDVLLVQSALHPLQLGLRRLARSSEACARSFQACACSFCACSSFSQER